MERSRELNLRLCRLIAEAKGRQMCTESFYEFVQTFWEVIIPEKPVWNWHIKYLCDELQKLAGYIVRREAKPYDLIINIPPGTTKPVWEESNVLCADGRQRKLKDIKVGDYVIGKSGRPCLVTDVHIQGPLECVRINTYDGRSHIAAPDHPFLTTRGWVNAGNVKQDDYLAVINTPKLIASPERSIDEFKLAGYLIGDGSVSSGNCSITNKTDEYVDELAEIVKNCGFECNITQPKNKNGVYQIRLTDGARQWIKDIGIKGLVSSNKKVPDFVWSGTVEHKKAFLASYFHCDGCVSYRDAGKRNIMVSMCTISEQLEKDLQSLFIQVGVPLKIRKRTAKSGFTFNRGLTNYEYYLVETTTQDVASMFLDKIPIFGYKKEKLVGFNPRKTTFEQAYHPDRVLSVENVGKFPCRCLTVKDDESFLIDNTVVHNSTITTVMFPAWIWTQDPTIRVITNSYSAALAIEHATKSRDIILSDKYRRLFPHILIRRDKAAKSSYENTSGGARYATSTGGMITGIHSHLIINDDPLNPAQAISEAERKTANEHTKTLASRKVDKANTPVITIMQRLHENDVTGYLLAKKAEKIRHICLPAELSTLVTPTEVRKNYVNGLLDPVRLSKKILDEQLIDLGSRGYSGQYDQNPVADGGNIVKREWFQYVSYNDFMGLKGSIPVTFFVDTAFTEKKENDPTGIIGTCKIRNDLYILCAKKVYKKFPDLIRFLPTYVKEHGYTSQSTIRIEPKANGISVVDQLQESTKLNITSTPAPTDSKETRLNAASPKVECGRVILVVGPWNEEFIEEICGFPAKEHDEYVDLLYYAIDYHLNNESGLDAEELADLL